MADILLFNLLITPTKVCIYKARKKNPLYVLPKSIRTVYHSDNATVTLKWPADVLISTHTFAIHKRSYIANINML